MENLKSIIKYFFLLSVLFVLICCAQKQKDSQQEFKGDQIAFIHSLDLYKKAQLGTYEMMAKNKELLTKYEYKDNVDSMSAFFNRYKREHLLVNEIYNDVIKEGQKVSDKYLDFLHPGFKTIYRDKFITAIRLSYEVGQRTIKNNYSDSDINYTSEMNKNIDELIQSFWSYIASIENDIHLNNPEIESALVKLMKE